LGIALRLYFLASIAFNYTKGLGNDFPPLSELMLPLDSLWALSPLLLLAAGTLSRWRLPVVALAFLPLSQRTLVCLAYACPEE
jgi:hypothetical protein